MIHKNYGFIITRHVNSEITNKYWNQCIKLIRSFYPYKQIIVIDDNSNMNFVKADFDYKNTIIINSEYPGRGELLPYIYLLKYKWFPNAVILHDSVFIHKRIPFEKINLPAIPLWHHIYDKENKTNLLRIASKLKNNSTLIEMLNDDSIVTIMGFHKNKKFNLCFGGQSFINTHFLEILQQKYKITNLISVITNRTDRCSFERILGLLFCKECPHLLVHKSLFGDILTKKRTFNYTYENYQEDLQNKNILYPFVKVWTGR